MSLFFINTLRASRQVTATSSPSRSVISKGPRTLQRKCACGGTPGLTGECEECRKRRLRRKSNIGIETRTGSEVPPIVHEVLRSAGQPLDAATREFMEPRFGHDFSRVRIHTNALAAESAASINASAFTVGPHIVFGAPHSASTPSGRNRLLGHELAHVIQQGFVAPTSPELVVSIDAQAEQDAERVAVQISNGNSAGELSPAIPSRVQRQETVTTPDDPMTDAEDAAVLDPLMLPPFDANVPSFPSDRNLLEYFESEMAQQLFDTLKIAWKWLGTDRFATLQLLDSVRRTAQGAGPLIECVSAGGSQPGPENLRAFLSNIEGAIGNLNDVPDSSYDNVVTYFEGAADAIEHLDPTFATLQEVGSVGSCVVVAVAPFLEGLGEGLSGNPEQAELFTKRLATNAVFTAIFPPVFLAGTVVGIKEDAVELISNIINAIKSPAEAARSLREAMKQSGALVNEIFGPKGTDIAREMGRNAGEQFTAKIAELNKTEGLTGFAYELGKTVGPAIVYTVLSLLGFEEFVAGRVILYAKKGWGKLKELDAFAALARLFERTPKVELPKLPLPKEKEIPPGIPKRLEEVERTPPKAGEEHKPLPPEDAEASLPEESVEEPSKPTPTKKESTPEPLERRPMDFPDGIPCKDGIAMLAQLLKSRPGLKGVRRPRHLGVVEYSFPGWSGWLQAVSGKREGVLPQAVKAPAVGGEELSNTLTPEMLDWADEELAMGSLPTSASGAMSRDFDSEAKALQYIEDGISPNHEGTISLFIEKEPCRSCSGVIDAFKQRHPNVKVNVTSIEGDC
jgi:hypothetical protein